MNKFNKEYFQALPTCLLRQILESTSPTSKRFAHEIVLIKEELERRRKK